MKSQIEYGLSKFSILPLVFLVALGAAWAGQGKSLASLQKATTATVPSSGASAAPSAPGTAVDPSFVIGPADVLAISVWKEPEISRTVPVRLDGKITLPLAGDIVASGMTTDQLQLAIKEKLAPYLTDPEVTVIIQEAKSKKMNVVGRVAKPGAYDLNKPTTILDGIVMAGGLGDFAKTTKIYVLRVDSDGHSHRIKFNYKQVLKGKNPAQNVELQPHDTIVVP
jgi:polysaccharide biosynthesis/export protein